MKLTPDQYLLLGYFVGVGVLLGYGVKLWLDARLLARREGQRRADS
jgi:hypothetical protein